MPVDWDKPKILFIVWAASSGAAFFVAHNFVDRKPFNLVSSGNKQRIFALLHQQEEIVQKVKKIVIWVAGILVFLFLALFILTWAFEEDIKKAVVASVNSRLNTEVKVKSFDFSLIDHFPKASVVFTDVQVMEPKDFVTTGSVLSASEVSLLFNLFDLLAGNYRLQSLKVSHGLLNLQETSDGRVNYQVWKSDTAGGEVSFQLQEVMIEDLRLVYYESDGRRDLDAHIGLGVFSGDFKSQKYTLTADADLTTASYRAGEVVYLSSKPVILKGEMDADNASGLLTFRNTNIRLDGLDLTLNGSVNNTDKGKMDLILQSNGSDLRAVFAFLPGSFSKKIDAYDYNGSVEFRCLIKGETNDPVIQAEFTAKNTGITPRGTDYHLTGLNFKGHFTNRKSVSNPVSWIHIEGLSGRLQGKPVSGEVEILNFSKPRVKLRGTLDASLEVLAGFLMPDTITDLKGEVKLNATFSGMPGFPETYVSSGSLQFKNVFFRIKGRPVSFRNFNGLLRLSGGDVVAEAIEGQAGKSDLNIAGTAIDLAGFVFLKRQDPLVIKASLQSTYLDLDELMAKDEAVASDSDTSYRFRPSGTVNFSLALNIDSLRFRKFNASNVNGEILLRDRVIQTKRLDMVACGGGVQLMGMIDGRSPDSLRIDYDARVKDLDISRLFYEMGNFGQEEITDKNLKGRVTAEVLFRSKWSDKLQVNSETIYAKSDLTITNGELNSFDPMLALSRYIKGTDLRNIRFSTLTNTIEIQNRKIFIPQMEIKSSALDLTLSGTHSFDNMVDYKLQLYLSQLTGKKVKQMNTEFGTIEEDGLGRSRIFLTMTGPASDPKFKVDRKGVEQKISGEIKNEVKSIRETLRQEFGRKERDTVKITPPPKKKQELEIEFED